MLATHSTLNRLVLLTALVVGATTAASVVPPHAKAVLDHPDNNCCPVSTKGIEIAQGQTARFELKNTGDEPVTVHLQFVDKKDKVVQQRDATIKPGKTEEMAYVIDNMHVGAQPVELRAQFGTKEARSIAVLRPTLLIFDGASQKTIRSIGPEDFYPTEVNFGYPTEVNFGPYGSTTALVTPEGGSLSIARLTVTNTGAEPAVVRLQFVDSENKVLVQQDATISPGGDIGDLTLEFPNGTGSFRAQFITKQRRYPNQLRPQLLIIDRASGQTVQIIGPEGFKNFQPAELRPGNDPD